MRFEAFSAKEPQRILGEILRSGSEICSLEEDSTNGKSVAMIVEILMDRELKKSRIVCVPEGRWSRIKRKKRGPIR